MTGEAASRLPSLDGLRGIAALTVLISHAANVGMLPAILGNGAGQTAVGLFFILSGFLMAYLYAHKPIARLPDYARHRFARVVPLYLAIVFLSILFPWAVFPIDTPKLILEHVFFVFGVDTLWTIPTEIQFYFLFALVWLSPKRAIPMLLLGQAAIAITFFVLRLPMTTLPFWLHFFLFGSLCGFAWRHHSTVLLRRSARYSWLGWPILLLAIISLPGVRRELHVPVLPTIVDPVTLAALALLFAGSLLRLGPLKAFTAGWARWLGKISYGVYLIHYPVLLAVAGLHLPGMVSFLAILAITLSLAALSFKFFEEPLRQRLTRRNPEPAPAPTLITPSAP